MMMNQSLLHSDTTNSDAYNEWQVNIDCSVPDDTLTVHIGGKSSFEHETILEVRIYCKSTDGSDQVSILDSQSLIV